MGDHTGDGLPKMTRHRMPAAQVFQDGFFYTALICRGEATRVEVAAFGWVDRAWNVALEDFLLTPDGWIRDGSS